MTFQLRVHERELCFHWTNGQEGHHCIAATPEQTAFLHANPKAQGSVLSLFSFIYQGGWASGPMHIGYEILEPLSLEVCRIAAEEARKRVA